MVAKNTESENATTSEVALVPEPEPMSGVTGEEEEWRELGGTRVPKKEWVKSLKDRIELSLYRTGAALGGLEAGEKDMEEFAQANLG